MRLCGVVGEDGVFGEEGLPFGLLDEGGLFSFY
jgi:hypothetical protein